MKRFKTRHQRDEDFEFKVFNRSAPWNNRRLANRLSSLWRKVSSMGRSRRSIEIEWGFDFESREPAVLTMRLSPGEVRATKKGRCVTCWGRLVGRLDRRTREFTGVRCIVCGKTIEGDAAQSEFMRMTRESVQNMMRLPMGLTPDYDQKASFVFGLIPKVEREPKEKFDQRIAACAARGEKKGWLTRRDFPAGSPGLFFLQAKLLMSAVENMPRVITPGSFSDVDLHDDGTATVRFPTVGVSGDPQFYAYDMSQKLGCTMTTAFMAAFACELSLKAVRLARLDEARRDHDLVKLYEDLPVDSRKRVDAAYPGVRTVLEKARHAFGKWRYFESVVGARGVGTMGETQQALDLGKAARVLLDEAECAGLTCTVELDGTHDAKRTGHTTNHLYKHKYKVVGGEAGRPVSDGRNCD